MANEPNLPMGIDTPALTEETHTNMSAADTTQEELESKKRKAAAVCNGTNSTITSHFSVEPKKPRSPPKLKDSKHAKGAHSNDSTVNLTDKVCTGLSASYLFLMVDVLPDRNHVARCRIILTRLLSAIKLADPKATIFLCAAKPESSNNKKHCLKKLHIDQPGQIPHSITQLQKFFPSANPRKVEGRFAQVYSFFAMKTLQM